jgi:Yip1-like protein
MIKALFLIFEPVVQWERVAQSQRGLKFMVVSYLLPMLLIVAAVESCGMVALGKWQSGIGQLKYFTLGETVIYQVAQLVLTLVVVAVCAHLVKSLGDTFHVRNTYQQAFTLVIYGLSPLFLLRLCDAIPAINPWIIWVVGMMLSVKVIYYGVPRIMEPDPPHAFGMYVMSAVLLAMVTGLERFITAWYLSGHCQPISDFITHITKL